MDTGPQTDIYPDPKPFAASQNSDPDSTSQAQMASQIASSGSPGAFSGSTSLKRPYERSTSSDNEESLQEGAHSVAVNLGMLTLNSDSSQKHYLGSSSGILFSNLIAASPFGAGKNSGAGGNINVLAGESHRPPSPAFAQRRFQALHSLLTQVKNHPQSSHSP